MKKKVVLLQHYYNEIGGIETFLYNFVRTFGDEYDLTLVCRDISFENAMRIGDYANVICEVPDEIECDICIITSVLCEPEVYRKIKYKEIYQMVHSDWTEMKKIWDWKPTPLDSDTKYISVSENARDSYLREFGKDSVIIPNLVMTDEDVDIRILSCTRLTEEKGYEQMCKLCDLFEKYGISYIWDVYGTNPLNYKPYGNMKLHKPVKDAYKLMRNYTYVAQLSLTESFCLTMYESLQCGVPVLVTPFPTAKKDVKDGVNGYVLPFDMNLTKKQVMDIVNKVPKNVSYEQEGVKELWRKLLN